MCSRDRGKHHALKRRAAHSGEKGGGDLSPSNCHENVRTNVFDREKILTTSLNNLVRGCKVMGYVFSRVYKKIGFSWSRKINVGRRCYKDVV